MHLPSKPKLPRQVLSRENTEILGALADSAKGGKVVWIQIPVYLWSGKGKANSGGNIEEGIPNLAWYATHIPIVHNLGRLCIPYSVASLPPPQRMKAEGRDVLYKHTLSGFPSFEYCLQGSGIKDHCVGINREYSGLLVNVTSWAESVTP